MNSVLEEQISEIEIKKSRFICYLKNISSESEAKAYIAEIKHMHPTAAHHCSAYQVGTISRANDDGEPSQTAGMPMLNVLNHNQLVNTIAVVVRYFGGIKLGTGGLVRAYTDSVVSAIDEANIVPLTHGRRFTVKATYSDIDKIVHIIKGIKIKDYEVDYGQSVIFKIECTEVKYDQLIEMLNNYNHLIKIENIEEIIVVED